jgi:hypothetical protein
MSKIIYNGESYWVDEQFTYSSFITAINSATAVAPRTGSLVIAKFPLDNGNTLYALVGSGPLSFLEDPADEPGIVGVEESITRE